MNSGIIRKTWREVRLATMVFALAFAVFEAILVLLYPQIFKDFEQFLQIPFFKTILQAVLGARMSEDLGPELPKALTWAHPIIIALILGHAVMLFTRIPAGEIGSGAIDILLSWPLSRSRIFLTDIFVCLASGGLVILTGAVSNFITSRFVPPNYQIPPAILLTIILNMFCMYLAYTAIFACITSACDKRARAVAIAFGVMLAFDLIYLLAEFWSPAAKLSFFTLRNYYQPLHLLQHAARPWLHILTLLLTALAFFTLALTIFHRRNIRTT